MPLTKSIFVATIGGQPQIATFALDKLVEEGEQFAEVHLVLLSPSSPRLIQANRRLMDTLKNEERYAGIKIKRHFVRAGEARLADVQDSADAAIVWEYINDLICQFKQDGYQMHVVISGGRRIIGMLTMSAAVLHFYSNDKLWHMYTPDDIQAEAREGKMMHLPKNSGFQLIEVPMLPLGSMFNNLRNISHLNQKKAFIDHQQQDRCHAVVAKLTQRQGEILELYAQGYKTAEIADLLHLTDHTVHSHKRVIFDVCRNVWGLKSTEKLTYHFLFREFESYF